jgi:hypothetical protein
MQGRAVSMRRRERTANDLVPIEAQAGFDQQTAEMAGTRPAVLEVSSGFDVVSDEGWDERESALACESPIFAKVVDGRARVAFIETDVVDLDTCFQVVTTQPVE